MSAAESSEVFGLVPVAPENAEKGASPIGTENRDLLTTNLGFPGENRTLSTTYPAHVVRVRRARLRGCRGEFADFLGDGNGPFVRIC